MLCFVEKVFVYCSFREKEAEWKTLYWTIVILSSPAQESNIIAIDSFPDISAHNSTSGNLEGSPWAAWNKMINSSTPVTLANLNMQILVLGGRELFNYLNFWCMIQQDLYDLLLYLQWDIQSILKVQN